MPFISRKLQIMSAFIAVLAILALWRPGTQPTVPDLVPITDMETKAVHHLQLERPGKPTLSFSLGESGWTMEAPYQLPAHEFTVKTLSSIVNIHSERQFSANAEQLASYGLDNPIARVVVNNNLVIDFGGTEQLSQQRYIMVNGQIFLVYDSWQRLLKANTEDFISMTLLPTDAKITAIDMPGLQLRKKGEEWLLTPALEHSLDQVQFLLDNWNYQQANTVQAYSGDSKDKQRVRIQLQDQGTIEFIIVNRNPLILARADLGIQYVLAGGMAVELLQLPALPTADAFEPQPQE